jgi:RNA polymerase sigma-70 factor (ECF subfamily)
MNPPTPVSLLERLRQPQNADAWRRFVRLYTPLLYRWARRTGLQAADAGDLVQDVFLLLVRHLPSFRYDPNRSFHRWLYTLLKNQWRERCRRLPPPLSASGNPALAQALAPAELEQWIDDDFRAHLAQRALQMMQTDFQQGTWRACWEVVVAGRRAADVAAELGLTVGAVYAARFRVLDRLRRELEGLDE